MTDIPEDVMRGAIAAGNGWLFTEPKDREDLNDVIARAIAAERLRCAELCDREAAEAEMRDLHGNAMTARACRDAILKGEA